jgi:hypothetical protein
LDLSDTSSVWPGAEAPSILALGAELASPARPEARSDAEVADFVQRAVGRVNPWVLDRSRVLQELARDRQRLYALADCWIRGHSAHPWEADLFDHPQIWLSRRRDKPSPQRFEPPRGYVGDGYVRPARGGLWTTTAIPGWPRSWFVSRVFGSSKAEVTNAWQLKITPSARLYEVRRADDFVELVERYPALRETVPQRKTPHWTLPAPLYLPDWEAAANDWDGIRLTMFGKLRTLYILLPVLDGHTVLIDSLACEETLWLNWSLDAYDALDQDI